MRIFRFFALAATALLTALTGTALSLPAASDAQASEVVRVYSYRQPYLIQPLFDAFEKETGIRVEMVYAQAGLLERLKNEGRNTPADLMLTADLPSLIWLMEEDLLQPVENETLETNIPAQYRDAEGRWFGLTMRARVIYASKERVEPGEITTYMGLADEKWRGRICTRPGDHPYNLGLIAGMIARYGEEKTKAWLEGVKANLARKPQGNDTSQVLAIKEGLCDLSLGNSYYMGKMLANDEQRVWAEAAYIIFPDQEGEGTHVNVSGAAMTKAAPNRENAVKLLEFLSGDEAQNIYSHLNHEYPVKEGVEVSELLQSWGPFKADDISLSEIAHLQHEALKLVNETGFNEGP